MFLLLVRLLSLSLPLLALPLLLRRVRPNAQNPQAPFELLLAQGAIAVAVDLVEQTVDTERRSVEVSRQVVIGQTEIRRIEFQLS